MRVTIENEHQSVGSSYYSVEAEKAAGYTKGGEIDKAIKSINERLTSLEITINNNRRTNNVIRKNKNLWR